MQSMRQLAVKASNDATTDSDRVNYQKQIDDYRKEIDRISRDTKYKERHLLNGDITNSRPSKNADASILTNIVVNESTLQGLNASNLVGTTLTVNNTNNLDITFQIKLVANGSNVDAQIFASDSSVAVLTAGGLNAIAAGTGSVVTLTGYGNLQISLNRVDASSDLGKTSVIRITSQDAGDNNDKSIAFQIGANAGEEMTIGVSDMSSNGLRITKLDVSSSLAAKNSVSMLDDAIDRITNERAKIGSMQNRLQVSISNSETYKANLEGSLAQEVDVDYAQAVLNQTIDQVKQQASLAMLTQANQSQQAVLGLLK
jgi:flagellin